MHSWGSARQQQPAESQDVLESFILAIDGDTGEVRILHPGVRNVVEQEQAPVHGVLQDLPPNKKLALEASQVGLLLLMTANGSRG